MRLLLEEHPFSLVQISSFVDRPIWTALAERQISHQAILTNERRPGRGTLLTIFLAISSEAVAAGEGALQTCKEFLPSTNRKSSTMLPSRGRACARTPLLLGIRSSACTSGIKRCKLRVNAVLLKERNISSAPSR